MLQLFVIIAGLITAAGAAPVLPVAVGRALSQAQTQTQTPAPVQRQLTSRIVVTVPAEDAQLSVNGNTIPDAGASRTFVTGPLAAGTHRYTFSVTWEPNTYTKITRSKVVSFRAGETVRV